MINLKTQEEIEKMRLAGKMAAKALKIAEENCVEGISTFEIDKKINEFIVKSGGEPSFLNYEGYPASSCISINDVVIHGIPSKDVVLKKGDVVSVDVGVFYEGFHGDTAFTFKVGEIDKKTENLLAATEEALYEGIKKAVIGNRIGDVSFAIEQKIKNEGFVVVKDFVGHGVGKKLHEAPEVPNFGFKGKGMRLLEGMVIAIEPMVNCEKDEIVVESDGWTVKTADKMPSAHFEHTVAITKNGPEILTKC